MSSWSSLTVCYKMSYVIQQHQHRRLSQALRCDADRKGCTHLCRASVSQPLRSPAMKQVQAIEDTKEQTSAYVAFASKGRLVGLHCVGPRSPSRGCRRRLDSREALMMRVGKTTRETNPLASLENVEDRGHHRVQQVRLANEAEDQARYRELFCDLPLRRCNLQIHTSTHVTPLLAPLAPHHTPLQPRGEGRLRLV